MPISYGDYRHLLVGRSVQVPFSGLHFSRSSFFCFWGWSKIILFTHLYSTGTQPYHECTFRESYLSMPATAYIAPRGLQHLVAAELQGVCATYGRLLITNRTPQPSLWALNTWRSCEMVRVSSIGHAAKTLRGIQRSWAPHHHPNCPHRRLKLICTKLPPLRKRRLQFPDQVSSFGPLGRCRAELGCK